MKDVKVCPKCGYINKPFKNACERCHADLSAANIYSMPKNITAKFFDPITREFCDYSPFENLNNNISIDYGGAPRVDKAFIEQVQELQLDLNETKICPYCFAENKGDAKYCVHCGRKIDSASVLNDENKNHGRNSHNDFSYSISIGDSGFNLFPITWDENSAYHIGRKFQRCLANDPFIADDHIKILNDETGNYFLFLRADQKNNHVYIVNKDGSHTEVLPGEFTPIVSGTIFNLANRVNITFLRNK